MNKDFEQFDENGENEEFDIIVLEDEENGESIELVIIDDAEVDGTTYLLVVPMQEFDSDSPSASIIKELKDENDEYVYELVEDDEEFNKAAEYFADEDEE